MKSAPLVISIVEKIKFWKNCNKYKKENTQIKKQSENYLPPNFFLNLI